MQDINSVVITGNLTKDPEMRHTGSGTPVANLRVAVNTRRKNQAGAWVDKANYFDVTVWGGQANACAEFLAKGRPVALEGRIEWREWEAKDGSGKRQGVEIIAESVKFLGSYTKPEGAEQQPADTPDGVEVPAGIGAGAEEDIPF